MMTIKNNQDSIFIKKNCLCNTHIGFDEYKLRAITLHVTITVNYIESFAQPPIKLMFRSKFSEVALIS